MKKEEEKKRLTSELPRAKRLCSSRPPESLHSYSSVSAPPQSASRFPGPLVQARTRSATPSFRASSSRSSRTRRAAQSGPIPISRVSVSRRPRRCLLVVVVWAARGGRIVSREEEEEQRRSQPLEERARPSDSVPPRRKKKKPTSRSPSAPDLPIPRATNRRGLGSGELRSLLVRCRDRPHRSLHEGSRRGQSGMRCRSHSRKWKG